jgi:tRNA pseudouridine38-40 synthase
MDMTWKVPVHFVCIELVATGFLRHMVRRIIGTARPIAEGTFPASRVKQVLSGELECGPSAPSKGLWLHRTWLTEADWDNDATKDD